MPRRFFPALHYLTSSTIPGVRWLHSARTPYRAAWYTNQLHPRRSDPGRSRGTDQVHHITGTAPVPHPLGVSTIPQSGWLDRYIGRFDQASGWRMGGRLGVVSNAPSGRYCGIWPRRARKPLPASLHCGLWGRTGGMKGKSDAVLPCGFG